MSDIMNQYELLDPFDNKDAGFSRWTCAKKNGKSYFLKEFLDPVYPTAELLSPELCQQRIRECEEYEKKKKKFYEMVNLASQGNSVRINEFFRFENHYYIATEHIVGQKIPIGAMLAVPYENRFLLCKTIAYEMMHLHKAHIVHSDIKDSNIIIKMTKEGRLVGKIIDFDAGFFESDAPEYGEDLMGDQVYFAPEACQFICGEQVKMTCKIDVFALGILFHQYLTGKMPEFDRTEYDYVFDAVLDEQELKLAPELSEELQKMIYGMLECDPEKRLSMEEVYAIFERIDSKTETKTIDSDEDVNAQEDEMQKWFFDAGDIL